MRAFLAEQQWEGEAPPSLRPGVPAWTEWVPSPHHSNRRGNAMRAIIYHFTAGPAFDGTVRYFQNNERRVSAHYVVGKDGRVAHMVPLERAAHHAGDSRLPGIVAVNSSSIGIEIVNWGPLTAAGRGYLTWSGKAYRGPQPIEGPDVTGRNRHWEPYTEAQFAAVARLSRDLVGMFPGLRYLTGHEDIAIPFGRKVDPGPAFNWHRIRAALPGFAGHIGSLRILTGTASAQVPAGFDRGAPPRADAQAQNRLYASRLGWGAHFAAIARLLGFTDQTPGEAAFSEALARWQRGSGLAADGILGPRTWAALRPLVSG